MANMAKDHDVALDQDMIGRLAEVIAELIDAGALQWSAHAGKPVTRRTREVQIRERGQLEDDIERWLRNG